MGQQQLLIFGVGILLVSVAVAAGTLMFGENHEKALYENITSEGLKMEADAVAWKRKTDVLDDVDEINYLDSLTLGQLGYTETNEEGTQADTDLYTRQLKSKNSKRPYVEVQPKTNTNLRVRVFMYGPDSSCIKVQRARKINGKWKNAGMDVGKDSPPVGCKVW